MPVPALQHVLSLPFALRFKMAYSADATTVVLGAFISAFNSAPPADAHGGASCTVGCRPEA
jgi:hypothetical protein